MNINDLNTIELPKLTDKQYLFVREYYRNRKNRVIAYRNAYNSEGKYNTVWKEATKLLNNPCISPYIEYYDKKYTEWAESEVKYSIQDAIDEADLIYDAAMESSDKQGLPNLQTALKAIELKCKIKGYGKENIDFTGGNITVMPAVTVNGKKLNYEVGENIDDSRNSTAGTVE